MTEETTGDTEITTEETSSETEMTTEETTEESADKEERGGGCSFGGQHERHHANRNGGLIVLIGILFGVMIHRSFKK